MVTPQFVDVSQFQPEHIDWQAYKAWSAQGDGRSRIAMRSTYGNGYTDAHFQTYREGALSAGIDEIYYYHYAYPNLNAPSYEANWQHQVVGAIRPQDLIVLDFEENTPNATSDWAYAWLVQQESNYGRPQGIYASSYFVQTRLADPRLAKYPLWLANWQFTPDERPPVPYPWTSYRFVQFTDRATNVPGIGAGNVDANIFLGVELPQEENMTIDLSNGTVASHFSGDDNTWKCKDNGFLVGYGILSFYRKFGGDALCGLTYLGLPRSNETTVLNKAGTTIGVVEQEFERATVRYDPRHQLDNPPGSGDCYLIHVEQDPRQVALQSQIADLREQLASGQTIPQAVKDDILVLNGNIAKLKTDAGIA